MPGSQAYVLLETSHGATALKHKIEEHVETGKQKFKVTVTFSNPYSNPFKTLPKDGAMRNNNNNNSSSSSSNNNNNSSNNSSNSSRQINQSGYGATTGGHTGGYDRGGYRGGRGNYNRGGYNAGSGFNSNRGGFQQQMSGGYQGGQMNNFSGMNSISSGWGGGGSFNRGGAVGVGIRGGNMGIRGGRGGMGNPGMIGMPMGGGMMPNMGMGMQPMNGGMIMQGMAAPSTCSDFSSSQGDHACVSEQDTYQELFHQVQAASKEAAIIQDFSRSREAT